MKKRITLIVFSVLIIVALYVLYCFNYIPHKKYTNADFNIEAYKSNIDKDNDGIDDQTDILNNANNYIKTNPKYKSKYYNTGYPNDEYGVCTDVVAFALKDAGYDLMVLVNEDIKNNKELYDIDAVDKNIDFRRVKNLKVYFDNNAISLTTDINEIEEWQGGGSSQAGQESQTPRNRFHLHFRNYRCVDSRCGNVVVEMKGPYPL